MSKKLTNVILLQECQLLYRNRILVSLFSILLLLLIAGLWIGNSMLQKQYNTIHKIEDYQKENNDSLKNRIQRIEANNMFYPGFIWDDPTFAYNVARNEGPQFAVKQPFALQALISGQSDIQPFYYKVYINKKQYLVFDGEIENSFLQFIGKFDFSFIVIYLLPLLIIVFTYNILSSEKEQGTWVLLKTSNQSIAKLILQRITFRYLLFTVFFWLVTTLAMIDISGFAVISTSNWWWTVGYVSLYFAFWFALAFLINSFFFSSTFNATILMGFWLLFVLLIPNLFQMTLDRTYPIPSRITLANEERNSINKYFEKDGQELSKEVFNNPRTQIRQASIVTPGMVYGYGVIVYKSQEIKDVATRVAEDLLFKQIEKQQVAIERLQIISPAIMMQETLAAMAGTHWHQFNAYSKDVDAFRKKTQDFYYPKMAYENTFRTFTVADANAIPTFQPKQYISYKWLPIKTIFGLYFIIVGLFLFIGYRRMLYNVK